MKPLQEFVKECLIEKGYAARRQKSRRPPPGRQDLGRNTRGDTMTSYLPPEVLEERLREAEIERRVGW